MATTINNLGITFPDGTTQCTSIPSGLIFMWYGSLASIPNGWKLCDGTNGTPDLRDKFIIGAATTVGYNNQNVGNIGGTASSILLCHTHSMTICAAGTHNHAFPTQDTSHTHTFEQFNSAVASGQHSHFSYTYFLDTPTIHTTTVDGEHNHALCLQSGFTDTNGYHAHNVSFDQYVGHCHCIVSPNNCTVGCLAVTEDGNTVYRAVHTHAHGNCACVRTGPGATQFGLCATAPFPSSFATDSSINHSHVVCNTVQDGAHQHSACICIAGAHQHCLANSQMTRFVSGSPAAFSYYDIQNCYWYICNEYFPLNSHGCYYGNHRDVISHRHTGYHVNVTANGAHCHCYFSINASEVCVTQNGSHDHTVDISPFGGTQSTGNLPPYYALAYLMKI